MQATVRMLIVSTGSAFLYTLRFLAMEKKVKDYFEIR